MRLAAASLNYGSRCLSSKMKTLEVQFQQFDLWVGGKVTPAQDGRYFDLINPSNGKPFAQVADASLWDMQNAISAARRAFDQDLWSKMTVAERGIYLKKIAQGIRKRAKELADLETANGGKTLKQTTFIDVPTAADTFEYFGSISEEHFTRENKISGWPVKSLTILEPMGVVGLIIPWNYPLIEAAWKMAPALAVGNTVILKPSSTACASVMKLAQIIQEARLPDGVVNIMATKDNNVASELVKNPDVNMISFTGGTETGRYIMQLASQTTKKVVLELGGKSPAIVFADCDLEATVGGVMSSIFMNQGQMCTAMSRLLLEDKIYDKFLSRLIEKTKSLQIGDASDYQTNFGPVISREHRGNILKAINTAVKEGAAIACGGKVPIVGAQRAVPIQDGFFIEPAILTNVKNSMNAAQEEIFGPVLCVMKFSGEEEAIKVANDSKYGLAACIWTKDLAKADRVAQKLRCGTVWINTYGGFYNEAPFGGYKQSGFGRELGLEGLLEYTQSKHICADTSGKPLVSSWF